MMIKYHFQVQIVCSLDDNFTFLAGVKVDDIGGQRQIFDVTKPTAEGQDLPNVEEGKNCDIFFC